MSNFNEEYKNKLVLNIKKYMNKFEKQMNTIGRIEYIAHNKDFLKDNLKQANASKVIKIIGTIWGIIILCGVAFIIYNELIIPLNINISLMSYVGIVIGVISLIVFLVIISIKNTKRIDKISVDSNNLTIQLLNSKIQTELENPKIIEYNLNETDLKIKRRRETTDRKIRNNTFNIYITYRHKTIEYLLTVDYEEEFFAFALYLEFILNNLKVKELTDDELYKMYHTTQYGLTFNKKEV